MNSIDGIIKNNYYAPPLKKNGKRISKGGYCKRVIFDYSDSSMGTFAIRAKKRKRYNLFQLLTSKNWVQINVKTNDVVTSILVNKNSLCKRLRIDKKDLNRAIKGKTVHSLIEQYKEAPFIL